jgi:hydroxymethylbilane synthase
MTRIRVGTRGSALALWQARHVAARLRLAAPDVAVELIEIVSTGDALPDVPLADVEGTGFFTATLQRALGRGEVDVAVHSYKDLPVEDTPGLLVAAVPSRGPVEDVLCARDGLTLASLPSGATVGTCSTRRTAQVLARRPDLDVRPLRGNVPTRVARVAGGELDAIVLARAGLERLGLGAHITEIFPLTTLLPAPAQGALAVECRAADTRLVAQLAVLDDANTRAAVLAERTLLHALGGGCSVPVAALAVAAGGGLRLRAGVFATDGSQALRVELEGDDPVALGEHGARQLLALGAGEMLTAVTGPAEAGRFRDGPAKAGRYGNGPAEAGHYGS